MISVFTRRKSDKKRSVAASGLTLPVIQDAAMQAKLRSEVRYCGTCSYEIRNPMTDRCPRCFSNVALSEHTDCGECSHQGNCSYGQ